MVRADGAWAFLALLAMCGAETAQAELAVDATTCLVKPKQVIQLGSPVFGVLAGVSVDRGDRVAQDQVVAQLDTSVEEAQVAVDRARAAMTLAIDSAKVDLAWNLRELARRQRLAGNEFSKANDIDDYVTKVDQDRIAIRKAESDRQLARLEAARSEAQLQLKRIRSPVAGVVTELKLSPGEFIYEQTPIMTIAQLDPLSVDLVAPAEQYGAVRVGATATLQLAAPVGSAVTATVDAIDPLIDAASDTFRVRLRLPNPGYAIPAGIRCTARVATP